MWPANAHQPTQLRNACQITDTIGKDHNLNLHACYANRAAYPTPDDNPTKTPRASRPPHVCYHSNNGSTPLHHAASNGHDAILQRLCRGSADANATDQYDGSTPLYYAARHGYDAVVRLLQPELDISKEENLTSRMVLFLLFGRNVAEIIC